MSLITATPDPVTGTVRLELEDGANYAGIARADHNGTRPVRTRANQKAAAPGPRTIIDYEPSLSGLIQYSLIEAAPSSTPPEPTWTTLGGGLAGPAMPSDLPRFILPSIPQFSVVVDTVHGYTAARTTRSTFHEIIGRDDSIVAEGRLTPRKGSLEVWLAEYIDARNLDNMLERGQVALYRQAEHPGMDMYFHVESTDVAPDEGAWKMSIAYREVDFPPGDVISGDGWTFNALKGRESFYTVARDFRSFLDLAIGQTVAPQ